MLRLERYEPPDGQPTTIRRLVLPWADIRAGLYVRSAVPYRTRVRLDPDAGGLISSLVLDRPSSIAVYRETPRELNAVNLTPCQVVVVIGTAGRLHTGTDSTVISGR